MGLTKDQEDKDSGALVKLLYSPSAWPSGEEERQLKEKTLYPHPKLSLGLVYTLK